MRFRGTLLTCIIAAAACGVPSDHTARVLPSSAIPANEPAPMTPTTQPAGSSTGGVIYLTHGEALVAVSSNADPTSAVAAISALLDWSPQSGRAGLRTAIDDRTRLLGVATDARGVLTVELSPEFVNVPSRDERLAVAQVVLTATSVPGVEGVRISIEGRATEVPIESGRLVTRPVNKSDYADLLAEPGDQRTFTSSGR